MYSPHTERMIKALEIAEERAAHDRAVARRPERFRREALEIRGRPLTPDSQKKVTPPTPPSPPPKKKKKRERS